MDARGTVAPPVFRPRRTGVSAILEGPRADKQNWRQVIEAPLFQASALSDVHPVQLKTEARKAEQENKELRERLREYEEETECPNTIVDE